MMNHRTLGDYKRLSVLLYGKDSDAAKFFDQKIKASKKGEYEPVLADESQMINLIASFRSEQNAG